MDTATLIVEQIDEGKTLVTGLKSGGFDVAVALWVLVSEDSHWFLYIASKVVDDDGLANAYRRVYQQLSSVPVTQLTRSDIKLIGPKNPIAQDALKYRHPVFGTKVGSKFEGRKLGNLIVDEAYIYAG